jgi:hypothetical protein
VMALLIADSPCLGEGFQTCGTCLRTAANTCNYTTTGCSSCGSEIHTCGQLISGCVWATRNNLIVTNPATYRQILSNIAINAMFLHGTGTTITPSITVDYLTLDDNDSNIGNGTPHYNEINNGFTSHNMPGPALQLLSFSFPDGQPTLVRPNGTSTLRVNVAASAGNPTSGTGVAFIDTGSGFQQYSMTELSANNYQVTFPVSNCGNTIRYYFRAGVDGGSTQLSPSNAPTTWYSATSAVSTAVTLNDNFQTDLGWTVTDTPSGTAAFLGTWVRVIPITPATTGAPTVDGDGSGMCFVTRNTTTNGDVDNGTTVLTSPAFDASQTPVQLSFRRWYHNGNSATQDTFLAEFSTNNGSSWNPLETVGASTGSWVSRSFLMDSVANFVPTSQFRLRFTARDLGTQGTIEAAIDGVTLTHIVCASPCINDVTGNGQVDIDDLLGVINAWGACAPPCPADVTGNGQVDIDDLLGVINGWGACP